MIRLLLIAALIFSAAPPADCPPSGCPVNNGGWGPQTVPDPQAQYPMQAPLSVARIQVPGADGTYYGTGVLVAPDLVLTNNHVVAGCAVPPIVHLPGQQGLQGRIEQTDPVWDLAAIRVSQQGARPVPIAQNNPAVGQLLTISGYGPQGIYGASVGRCGQYVAPKNGLPPDWIQVNAAVARKGDSGGPIIDANGELAGILWGSDASSYTVGPCCQRIRQFLGLPPRQQQQQQTTPPAAGIPATPPAAQPPPASAPIAGELATRLQALEQAVAAQPGQLGTLRDEIGQKLEAIKADLAAHPEKILELEKRVAELAAAAGAAPAAAGSLVALVPMLASGPVGWGIAGLALAATLWKKFGAQPPSGVSPAVGSPAAGSIATHPSMIPAQANGTAAAPAPAAAAPGASAPAAPAAAVLPQVTNNVNKYVQVQVPTNRQKALEQALTDVAQRFPGTAGVLAQVESSAQQFESGMAQTGANQTAVLN